MARKATNTKSRILQVARTLYSTHGCDNTTLDDIITATGITKGAFYHYFDNEKVKLITVEAAGKGVDSGYSAATTTLGKPGILHGSKTMLMQTEDGQVIEPYSISAGLDYPGIGPLHAHLFETGRASFHNVTDDEAMQAGIQLSRLEGIIPAIETAHALAILEKLNFRKDDIVVVNLSGRGDKDLETFIKWGGY